MNSMQWSPLTRALALAGVVLAGSATAQALTPGVELPPEPGIPRPLVVPQFEEATLPNGVRVVVVQRHELPLVSLTLHLALGGAAEPEGQAGLASMTASLCTKGATVGGKLLSASQLAAQAEALGGSLDASSDWRGTAVGMTVASDRVDAAAALIAGAVRRPALADAELQRLKDQAADGLKLSLSDPMALAGMAARRAYWGSSVFGASTTPASLKRLDRAAVQAFHRQWARPDLATLMVAGDVTLAQAVALAQRQLGDWQAPRQALPVSRQEPPQPATPATVLINLPGAGQSGVVVMAPSVADDSPERRVAQVANAVLGGGYSARLNREVRVKRGLSYGASAGLERQPGGGRLSAQTQTNHATAAQVVGLLQAEITRMGQAEGLSDADELGARKASLVGGFGRSIETTAGLSGVALELIARHRPLSELQRFAPEIQAVSAEQVRDFAARHWTPANLRTVVVGDLAAAGASLRSLDPQALVLEALQLDLESPGLVAPPPRP